jgi:hypothetical protein
LEGGFYVALGNPAVAGDVRDIRDIRDVAYWRKWV